MKLNSRTFLPLTLLSCALGFAAWTALAMGGDYPKGPLPNNPSWPQGMTNLVNATNRIGGVWVNEADTFFFSGTASNLNAFLADYAKISAIAKHRLILHEGAGSAFDLGGGNRRPCDWQLYGCPAAWANAHGISTVTKYVLEVTVWTGGNIHTNQLVIPANIEVTTAK